VSERSINDFVILEDRGFYDMAGIKTPGITCSFELGEYIASRVISGMDKQPSLNPSFSPYRKRITRFSEHICSDQEKDLLPEDYYDIICRCEHISRGEVMEAIRRGASTVDGVKRRTGAGTGRCQGGYCMEKILHLLSLGTGRDIYSVTKDGPGSEVLKKS